jgi:hypothetical protein
MWTEVASGEYPPGMRAKEEPLVPNDPSGVPAAVYLLTRNPPTSWGGEYEIVLATTMRPAASMVTAAPAAHR